MFFGSGESDRSGEYDGDRRVIWPSSSEDAEADRECRRRAAFGSVRLATGLR